MKYAIPFALIAAAIIFSPAHAHDKDRDNGRDKWRYIDREDREKIDVADKKVRRGFEISPVPLNLRGKNYAQVGLGSYLVNAVGACNDCHTNPPHVKGGEPYLGEAPIINAEHYLAGGNKFGPFTARNLTPNANGLPAGLTLVQFKNAMRNGKDYKKEHPQISPLLQVMPWPAYNEMLDSDLEAMYEFLRSIPHAEPGQ